MGRGEIIKVGVNEKWREVYEENICWGPGSERGET